MTRRCIHKTRLDPGDKKTTALETKHLTSRQLHIWNGETPCPSK